MLSSLTLDEKNIMISYKGKNIINDIEVFVRIRDFELKELKLTNHTFLDNKYTLFFEDEEKITECKLEFGVCNDLLKIYAYINCRQELMISNRYIAPENGFIVRFNIPEKSDGVVATYMENAYWTLPFYSDDAKNLPNHTQNMLFKSGSEHISFLTKHLNNAIVELGATNKKTEIRCSTISAGFKQLEGEIMSICIEKTPSEAICKNYEYMGNKQKKAFPKMFNKLGWCSWNAFYHDVTEEKLFAKLEEFKRKDIPIKWILIDDGWSMTEDNKLLSFCEDKNKFPHGLGYFVQKAKSEYGIEYV